MQQEIPVLARPAAGGCLTFSLPCAGGEGSGKTGGPRRKGRTYMPHIHKTHPEECGVIGRAEESAICGGLLA